MVTNSISTSLKQRNQVLHLGLHQLNPPSQWQVHETMEILGRAAMCAQKDKGTQTQACMNGETMNYSFLSLKCSPPLMHRRGSIYIPSIGNEGSSQSISKNMEGQESSYSGLIEENSKNFCFYAHFPMYTGYSGASYVYTRVLA